MTFHCARSLSHRPTSRAHARRSGVALLACLASTVLASCGGGTEGTRTRVGTTAESTAVGSAGASSAATAAATPACTLEGDWSACAVEDRLVHAGLVLEKRDEPARHRFFSVPGVTYQIGGKDDLLEVYLYSSTEARRRDTDALDSATVSPKGTREIWSAPPTLVTSNNLAAVVLSLNDRTIERLSLALAAGLPQPKSP